MVVELGNLTGEAARWWAAVLAPGEDWKAAIPHERWRLLSPWSVTKDFNKVEILLTGSLTYSHPHSPTPASFQTALKYINSRGMKDVLGSIFYESGVPANACGAWLQGTMAVLQSKGSENLHVLARMFFDRSPHISYLWLGGVITGAHRDFLRNTSGLLGFNRIDLHEAAWTGTLMSFIKEPVSPIHHDLNSISGADECRLLFWTQEPPREFPPMYPYPPLGDTETRDTDLGVQLHGRCPGNHGLQFLSLTRNRVGGRKDIETTGPVSVVSRDYIVHTPQHKDMAVERYLSDGVTRNLFSWMRDMDGLTVAERDIYRHE
ncbi:hypothetical protein BKA56DRAFT_491798 [Ilyonectria sp. MPI-CAGE-AT-0026]|nr:hypothetical protein BKA56DRAFT_491798 [Ilyonectria sp. MPI-CAGE-AT-0026]